MRLAKRIARVLPAFSPVLLKTVGPLRHFFWRHKPKPALPVHEVTPDMVPQPLEGYCNKQFYRPGETVSFHIKATLPQNQLTLQHYTADLTWTDIAQHYFQELPQQETLDEAQQGCHWSIGWQFALPTDVPAGYYRALLRNPELDTASEIHFLVGTAAPKSNVAVLAPVTTWLAYNAYGGQSLYRNAIHEGEVPFVSALRPNTALSYQCTHSLQHSLRIEANIYLWFSQRYAADLYPDYFLEAEPDVFKKYQVVVLAYHAEYFSQKMYSALQDLVFQEQKSLVALGGNQVYWQVRWHRDFTQLECRKSGSFFQNEAKRGCLWRNTSKPEALLLGAQFSEPGMGTYAPYRVLAPQHWLFAGTQVNAGDVFGEKGLDALPICGDETDKTCWSSPAHTIVLAKGLNKSRAEAPNAYVAGDPAWDGSGGGELTYTQVSAQHAVLNTGAIHSGSGLGTDAIFTQLLHNFMQRYLRTSTGDTTA